MHCSKKSYKSFTVYPVWIRTPGKHVNLIVPSFHFISYPMYWIQVKQYKRADVSYDVFFFLVIKHNKGPMSLCHYDSLTACKTQLL